MSAPPRKAVFLDRDGVLNVDFGYVFRLDQLELTPTAATAVAELARRGYLRVVVTNQSGVARGMYQLADVAAFNAALHAELVRQVGFGIDHFEVCPQHPEAREAALRIDDGRRKPQPGMVLDAARALNIDLSQSFLVGDRDSDIECAVRAGVAAIQIEAPKSPRHPKALAYVSTLQEALAYIP